MEFRANAAIDQIGQGFNIVHAHVILVLKVDNLGARHTIRHRLVSNVHRVVYPCDGFGCVAHGEQVHLGRKPISSTIGLPLVSSLK